MVNELFMRYLLLTLSIIAAHISYAQTDSAKVNGDIDTIKYAPVVKPGTLPIRFEIVDGDTIPVYKVDEVFFREERDTNARKAYLKLVRNVRKAMPYAKLAAMRMQMLEDNLNLLKTKKAKRQYIKATQKAVKEDFMDDLKKMSRSQGVTLLKLIHRETGKTTFEIMKGYRGGASALMWEAMAGVYGASTKDTYDPVSEHTIEFIIKSYKLE
jgi:hypothetical protein